ERKRIEIAVDGSRCFNNVTSDNSPVSFALANGAWIKNNAFKLTVRWIETCFERKFLFIFNENEVEIKNESVEMFAPKNNTQVKATAVNQ
ncbi:MAG TPA: hypothetical protein VHP38_10345, partial [Ruminiclostridium sp.]|nr:hypothetical protein [Ruminiclostridium sp.]